MRVNIIALIFVVFLMISVAFANDKLEKQYPRIDLAGYKQYLYHEIKVEPFVNYFIYPSGRFLSSGSWVEALSLYIKGEFNPQFNVAYQMEQLPINLETYNFSVSYENYLLSLGDQLNFFRRSDLILQDYLDGTGFSTTQGDWNLSLFSGQYPLSKTITTETNENRYFRSPQYSGDVVANYLDDNQHFEYWGFKLGRFDIKENTVELYLDGKKMVRDFEFYVYHDLVLFQSVFRNAKEVKIVYLLNSGEQKENIFDLSKDAKRWAFRLPYRFLDASETISIDGIKQQRGIDYKVSNINSLLVMTKPLPEDAEVNIDYTYTYGLYSNQRQASGASVGYNLLNWNTIKISYLNLSPRGSDIALYDISNQINIGSDTYMLGEISLSTNAGKKESSSALRLEGASQFNNIHFSLGYKNILPQYASLRKIKKDVDWKNEEGSVTITHSLSRALTYHLGYLSCVTKEGTDAEFKITSTSLGADLNIIPNNSINLKYGLENENQTQIVSQYYSDHFSLLFMPIFSSYKTSDIILKLGNVNYGNSFEAQKIQMGYKSVFSTGSSLYLNLANETANLFSSSLKGRQNSGLVKIIYPFNIWDKVVMQLFGTYSNTQQENSVSMIRAQRASNVTESTEFGFLFDIPQDNVVLSNIDLEMSIKSTNYIDNLTSSNNYRANEIRFSGVLDF